MEFLLRLMKKVDFFNVKLPNIIVFGSDTFASDSFSTLPTSMYGYSKRLAKYGYPNNQFLRSRFPTFSLFLSMLQIF